ncbi:MAG TPA: hypothetical protein VMA72_25360 [Streptosporangiaceae bacterium]|nr:hypothetical protein [Streptosporangiaceae bacterium]
MKKVFGPHTRQVLEVLARLRSLSPGDVDLVTVAWKHASAVERAEAWAQLNRATSRDERYPILAAAAAGRRTAMDTARNLNRTDWAFWAAAWDVSAAVAAGDAIGGYFEVLAAPVAEVMPSLAEAEVSVQSPARVPSPRSQHDSVAPAGPSPAPRGRSSRATS